LVLSVNQTHGNLDIHKIQNIQEVSLEFQKVRAQRRDQTRNLGKGDQRLSLMKDQILDKFIKEE
jgi:hypothetical protein